MESHVEGMLIQLLGRDTFSSQLVVERAHRVLQVRPLPSAPPRPIIARILNYGDRDAALRRACELKSLTHEGAAVSQYPDFTQQVQDARRQCIPGERQLREMRLEYRMLYPSRL
ncbi:hypothetical protein NDU88_010361 [Pleurodeles waltl]|uniref:Uncharacterized protein n=1 Tax=Pleurodeles waltl TaxID=8319 RepID=A0AAV7S133_PLEWA|nr:hypothetical protein NDU88_010361 [Pleurodeles waltl]